MNHWRKVRKAGNFGLRLMVSIFFLLLFCLYQFSTGDMNDFQISQESNVLLREVSNKSDHPFPYTASVIVGTCLFGIAAIIICLGGNL